MLACPHTHAPHPHEIAPTRRGADELCATCGGGITRCGACGAPNRSAARFCTVCGRPLPVPATQDPPLLSPGQIRDALAGAKPLALRHGPALAAGLQAFLWRACPLGVLIFACRSAEDPTRVSLLDSADIGRGRALTANWPPFGLWLAEPMIGPHGAFVATAEAVHGLAFHGHDSVGEAVDWRPTGGSILAAALSGDGLPSALVTGADGRLSVWSGNGQAADWRCRWTGELRVEPGAPALFGALPGIAGKDPGGVLWLLAGGRLHVLDLESGGSPLSFDARAAAPRSHLIRHRLGAGQLDPIAFGARNGEARLALTTSDGAGALAVQVMRPGNALRRIGEFSPTSWVIPSPGGEGLLVGDGAWLRLFLDCDLVSKHEMKGVLFSQTPVLSGHTLMALAERRARLGGTPEAELVMLELPAAGSASAGDIRVLLREPLPGVPAAGLSPLLAGAFLLLALEGVQGDVTVHSLRVHEPTGAGR